MHCGSHATGGEGGAMTGGDKGGTSVSATMHLHSHPRALI